MKNQILLHMLLNKDTKIGIIMFEDHNLMEIPYNKESVRKCILGENFKKPLGSKIV